MGTALNLKRIHTYPLILGMYRKKKDSCRIFCSSSQSEIQHVAKTDTLNFPYVIQISNDLMSDLIQIHAVTWHLLRERHILDTRNKVSKFISYTHTLLSFLALEVSARIR